MEFGGDEAKELPALLQDIEDEEGGNYDRVASKINFNFKTLLNHIKVTPFSFLLM